MTSSPMALSDIAGETLTTLEVARVLRVSQETVYEMIYRGDLRAKRPSRRFIIPKSAVLEYLAASSPLTRDLQPRVCRKYGGT